MWCVCLHRGQYGRYYVYAVLSKRSQPLRSFLLRRSTASGNAFFTAELLPYLPPLGMSAAGIVSRIYMSVLQKVCISYVHRSHSSHHFTTPTLIHTIHTRTYTHTNTHTHQHTNTRTHTHTQKCISPASCPSPYTHAGKQQQQQQQQQQRKKQ